MFVIFLVGCECGNVCNNTKDTYQRNGNQDWSGTLGNNKVVIHRYNNFDCHYVKGASNVNGTLENLDEYITDSNINPDSILSIVCDEFERFNGAYIIVRK